ncbi:GNAT family N-acetyltransferase, partial [Nocardiopsis tropica]|nr:GNAT family N-acetyltransferase [Nocardiopsis tropica]
MNRRQGRPVTLEEGPVTLRPRRLRDAVALRDTRSRTEE